jgi:hypothetical protein
MRLNFKKISEYTVYFITFIGFHAVTALMMAFDLNESRTYTIPMRILVVILMFYLIVKKRYKLNNDRIIYLLLGSFFAFYFFKISVEMMRGTKGLFIPAYEFMLYSIIYCIIPFIFFSQPKKNEDYNSMFMAILWSGIFFSLVSLYHFIKISVSQGHYERFSTKIDPLTFSYVGALLIGVCTMKLLFDKSFREHKKTLVFAIICGIIPFLIGGSRGPIIALIIPILFAIFYYYKLKIKRRFINYFFFVVIAVIVASLFFGDTSFKRLFNLFSDLEKNSGEVIRLDIWKESFNQFLHSPVWGDSIQKHGGSYPHNLIIEVLMATGVIGFIPYFLLLLFGMNRSIKIIRRNPSQSWISFFFILAFLMGMLSGNICSDIWYWSSMGLVYSVDLNLNRSPEESLELLNINGPE